MQIFNAVIQWNIQLKIITTDSFVKDIIEIGLDQLT